jgi:L-iditol 2-dehydrogenase
MVPTPRPGPRQLLARVDAAGICTSLIKLVEQGPVHQFLYGWDIERHPLILGDEGSVTIVQVGPELQGAYRVGERYVPQPAVDHTPVNHRERYRDGARGVEKIAIGYTLGGNLAEYILITEEILAAGCLLPVTDPAMAYAHASLAEPLSCVISAHDHHLHLTQETPESPRGVLKGLRPGGVTVVVGAGVMGRMHVDIALSCRPRAVVVSDLIEDRLDVVRRLFGERAEKTGAELLTVNPARSDVQAIVDNLTSYAGADDVIVAVGSKRAIESAQHLVGRGGVLDLFGGLKAGQSDVSLDSRIIHYKEINVTGSSGGSPWDIARTLEALAGGEIDGAAHITRIGDLDHAAEFLSQVKAQEIDGKAIVYPHRHTEEVLTVSTWTADDESAYLAR